jgi:predicted DNA-binding helix-hairpin-helix protein
LGADGNMDLSMDPKLAWALQHREQFPMDVNRASREQLLRVPGMGVKSVERLIRARRHRRLRMDDLGRLRLPMSKVAPFVVAADHQPGGLLDSARLQQRLVPKPRQPDLFG